MAKGLVSSRLVLLILVALSLVIIAFFMWSYIPLLTGESNTQVCRARFELLTSPGLKEIGLAKGFNNFCKEDKVTIQNMDEEEVIDEIVRLLDDCWYKYGEGSSDKDFLDLWSKLYSGSNGLKYGCLPCAEIDFRKLNIAKRDIKQDKESNYYIDASTIINGIREKRKDKFKDRFAIIVDPATFFNSPPTTPQKLYLNKKYKIHQFYIYLDREYTFTSTGEIDYGLSLDAYKQYTHFYPYARSYFSAVDNDKKLATYGSSAPELGKIYFYIVFAESDYVSKGQCKDVTFGKLSSVTFGNPITKGYQLVTS